MSENLNEVNCSVINLPYVFGAADECETILRSLGFHVQVKGTRGSHGAEIYVPEEEQLDFNKQVLRKAVIGKYRKFFISDGIQFGVHYYYVSYSKK